MGISMLIPIGIGVAVLGGLILLATPYRRFGKLLLVLGVGLALLIFAAIASMVSQPN
jgi:hypothetical protein